MKVISSSMCMSTYKAVSLGSNHKRVPEGLDTNPVMTGHEFAGILVEVGANLTDQFHVGEHVAIQPAMGLPTGESPGYSYPYFGGDSEYAIIPQVAIELGCVLPYDDDYFANASLAEPMMCVIGAFNANYHTRPLSYIHDMGILENGKVAILGAGGPMGLAAVQYALASSKTPSLVVATDVSEERLRHLEELVPSGAHEGGTELVYLCTDGRSDVDALLQISGEGGYDDVFVFAPVVPLLEVGDRVLGVDGCLNFFAGPTDPNFSANFNFYRVHYDSTHVVGTSGGNSDDMREGLSLSAAGAVNPSMMVTHIGGLDAVPEAIMGLPTLMAGKRMIYPQIRMPLTAIADFQELGKENALFARLAQVCANAGGIWSREAEAVLRDGLEGKDIS